jgi:hypothetical protein
MSRDEQEPGVDERREYFRIDDSIRVSYTVVDAQSVPEDIEERVHNDRFSVMTRLQAISQHLSASFHRIEQRDPDVADYLKALDEKIILLGQSFLAEEKELLGQPSRSVNLSAGGLALDVADELAVGDRVEIKLLLLPSYTGPLMNQEILALRAALEEPRRPTAAVVGGSKVSTKIPVLTNLVAKVDKLIIGGCMANTFLAAQGIDVGRSLCEHDLTGTAREIVATAKDKGCEIVLPVDAVVAREFKEDAEIQTVAVDAVPADAMILDVGPQSVARLSDVIAGCRTLLWNGPLGAFEIAPFGRGTFALAEEAAKLTRSRQLISVAGGGDTVAALNAAGVADEFTYISTAGGAFLEWLEGRALPGVVALIEAGKVSRVA